MDPTHTQILKSWEECYETQREFLIAYAFRMTGSLEHAEDIVQDTVAQCLKTDFGKVTNHRAWMTRICSNKALDLLKSAESRRMSYIGTWLPDLIPDALDCGISHQTADSKLELSESITISFLVLLQALSPVERAVFLLKDVFDYPFKMVSELSGKSEQACRKIAERARNAVSKKDVKFTRPSSDAEKLVREFFEAAKAGDKSHLATLLSDHSLFLSDGGGKVAAAPLIETKDGIIDFFCALQKSPTFSSQDYRLDTAWINSRPGIIISKLVNENWRLETLISFEIEERKISRIFAQRNPDKLKLIDHLFNQ